MSEVFAIYKPDIPFGSLPVYRLREGEGFKCPSFPEITYTLDEVIADKEWIVFGDHSLARGRRGPVKKDIAQLIGLHS